MVREGLFLAALCQFCALAQGLQVCDGPLVEIVPTAKARPPAAEGLPHTVLRVESSLVLIPVHVTTVSGSSVTDLKKENFTLFEDGVPQTITHFAQDDMPVSVGVLLDISGSMKNKMVKVAQAATEFFKSANPEDEFFLVEFSDRAKVKIPFTRDWREISGEILRAKPFGLTALLDAIHLAGAQMKHAKYDRKAIVILSDGGDNYSRRNLRQLKNALIESDVQVYAMGIFDPDYAMKHAREERNGPRLLDEVAIETGGQDYPVRSLDELSAIGVQIARELRNQYILGYAPANPAADGKYRRVNLKLTTPSNAGDQLRAYYRHGYYAPDE